jgi:hypothetical protein
MASLAAQRGEGDPQALGIAPTPHMADGHPDLNGWWGGGGGGVAGPPCDDQDLEHIVTKERG